MVILVEFINLLKRDNSRMEQFPFRSNLLFKIFRVCKTLCKETHLNTIFNLLYHLIIVILNLLNLIFLALYLSPSI